MKTLNVLRGALAIAGSLCFAIGWLAAISHGTFAEVQTLGNTLIVAGAILIGAVLITSAIVANKTSHDGRDFGCGGVGVVLLQPLRGA